MPPSKVHQLFSAPLRLGVFALKYPNAIREDRTPNLLLMRYALATWEVRDLLLIPSFMFSESAVIKRKLLAATARRAGWVGCNFALNRVPAEARIPIVTESQISPAAEVRAKYKRVKPLKDISVTQRGWTLDVLNIVRRLVDSRRRGDESLKFPGQSERMRLLTSSPTNEFTTAAACAFERELEQLHPDNRHVKDNPVNNRVTRGRNPPATSSAARFRIIDSHRSWRMEVAVISPRKRC
jgi:hypothetical protein